MNCILELHHRGGRRFGQGSGRLLGCWVKTSRPLESSAGPAQGPFNRALVAFNSGYLGYVRGQLGGLGI